MSKGHAYTQIPGHGLAREGYPHDESGNVLSNDLGKVRTSGFGQAKCSCGELSPRLSSTVARKEWHRDVHKPQFRTTPTGLPVAGFPIAV